MSELKAISSGEIYNIIEYEGSCITDDLYYPKSEADAVIADLIEKNKRLARKDIIMASNAIKDVYKELHHSKYKRCLAMYRYCSIKALYELDFKGNDVEWKWYSKWMHKWFKLAKQFKELKNAED